MRNRVRAVLVSSDVLRAERVMLLGLASSTFLQKAIVNRKDLSAHEQAKQLKSLYLVAFVDVRQRPRYLSLKAETGVRFP